MSQHTLWHGVELLNQGKYFEAHEVLEDVWRAAPPEQKKLYQGLVQVAVAFHHHSSGNLVGMCSVLKRAAGNLEEAPSDFAGIDMHRLLRTLQSWNAALEQGDSLPDPPRIERFDSGKATA